MTNPEMQEINDAIELGEELAKLRKNKAFKKIIEDLYLDGGSINLAKNINVVKNQEAVVEQIKSRGFLYRFLMEIEEDHINAIEALKEYQADLAE